MSTILSREFRGGKSKSTHVPARRTDGESMAKVMAENRLRIVGREYKLDEAQVSGWVDVVSKIPLMHTLSMEMVAASFYLMRQVDVRRPDFLLSPVVEGHLEEKFISRLFSSEYADLRGSEWEANVEENKRLVMLRLKAELYRYIKMLESAKSGKYPPAAY